MTSQEAADRYWDVIIPRLERYVFSTKANNNDFKRLDHRINRAQKLRKVYLIRMLDMAYQKGISVTEVKLSECEITQKGV